MFLLNDDDFPNFGFVLALPNEPTLPSGRLRIALKEGRQKKKLTDAIGDFMVDGFTVCRVL
jgi:hypothetical protein